MRKKLFFVETLLDWFEGNIRDLPWKETKNPYFIWLSEIILQQTRVEQGLPYYLKFVERFPTVVDLANATEDEVLKLWEGLGYYTRARNLHASAKYISKDLNGIFPERYEEILKLKGVGPYTAAAIASFAFGLPHAVVDGNVYRVLSRFFGITLPIDSTLGKKYFFKLANELLVPEKAGDFNQAMMDFGATQCKPAEPDCIICPFQSRCFAWDEEMIAVLPVKEKRIKRTERFFYYIVAKYKGEVVLHKRTKKDIWKNLFEFPLNELTEQVAVDNKKIQSFLDNLFLTAVNFSIRSVSRRYAQQLTHQKINAVFIEVELNEEPELIAADYFFIQQSAIVDYAFPKIMNSYLSENFTI